MIAAERAESHGDVVASSRGAPATATAGSRSTACSAGARSRGRLGNSRRSHASSRRRVHRQLSPLRPLSGRPSGAGRRIVEVGADAGSVRSPQASCSSSSWWAPVGLPGRAAAPPPLLGGLRTVVARLASSATRRQHYSSRARSGSPDRHRGSLLAIKRRGRWKAASSVARSTAACSDRSKTQRLCSGTRPAARRIGSSMLCPT